MKIALYPAAICCLFLAACSKKSDTIETEPVSKTHTIRVVTTADGTYGNYIELLKPEETTYAVVDSQDNVTSGSYEYTTKQDVGTTVRVEMLPKTAKSFTFTFYDNGTIVGKTQSATGDKVTTQYLIQ